MTWGRMVGRVAGTSQGSRVNKGEQMHMLCDLTL